MQGTEPTHGDILKEIGELKGQMTAITLLVTQKREDLNTAFALIRTLEGATVKHGEVESLETRLRKAENSISNWAGICIAISVFLSALPALHKILVEPHPEKLGPAAIIRLPSWITPTDSAASTWSTPKPGR